MKRGKEMFEAIEMHVEKMLAKCSANERKQNLSLTKYEERMREILNRLRKVVSGHQSESAKHLEVFDAEI